MLYMIVVLMQPRGFFVTAFYALVSLENFTCFLFRVFLWCLCFCFAMFNGAYDYFLMLADLLINLVSCACVFFRINLLFILLCALCVCRSF